MNWPWISRKKHDSIVRQCKIDVSNEWRSALYDREEELRLLQAALAAMRAHPRSRGLTQDEVPYVEVFNTPPHEQRLARVINVLMPSYGWLFYLNPLMMLCKGDPADHVAADFSRGWDEVKEEAIQRVRDAVQKELERG